MRVALYSRTSTAEQFPENQLLELRRYSSARGWAVHREYVDHGYSGTDKKARPAFDELMRDAKRRRFDAVVCWRLDRWSRNLKNLIVSIDELTALGVAFVSLNEGIDATTPAGRLQMNVLASIAAFESARVGERVRLGLARAKAQGVKLGRKRPNVTDDAIRALSHLSVRAAAQRLGVSKSFVHNFRSSELRSTPPLSEELRRVV